MGSSFMKSIYIRCSEEVAELAKLLAEKENRSVNKQIIHMIRSLAQEKNISFQAGEKAQQPVVKKHPHGLESWDANGSPVESVESIVGLKGLVGRNSKVHDHTSND